MSKTSRLRKNAMCGFLWAPCRQLFKINDKNAPDNVRYLITKEGCFRKSDRDCAVGHNGVGIGSVFTKSRRKIHRIDRRTRGLPEGIDFAGQGLQWEAEFGSGAEPEEPIEDNPGPKGRQSDQRFFDS